MRLTKNLPHIDWRLALCALAVAILLTACGGDGSSTTTSSGSGDTGSSATVSAFPTGVALSSPTALGNSSDVVASAASTSQPRDVRLADWGRAMWQAIRTQDTRTATALITRLLPLSTAHAATSKAPEGLILASKIEAVAEGRLALSAAGLTLADLFPQGSPTNAACFGPSISYTTHDDWTFSPMDPDADGSLPSGDLGMWLASSTDNFGPGIGNVTQPCAAAQLSKRLDGTKKQVHQAMLLMAGMRRLIESSSTLEMPAAGATTDVQAPLSTLVGSVLPGVAVDAATVALNGGGSTYTYRLTLSTGSGATARQGEIVIRHTPGASDSQFTGVIQVTAASVSTDAAFGCDDASLRSGAGTMGDPYQHDVATVTTVRYDRNGTTLNLGARSAHYCGEINTSASSYIDDIAALDGNGMLDLSVDLGGGSTRGATKGWRGNASRFGAAMDTATQAGDFLYIWQAGNNDSHTRAFAVHSSYNSSTEARTLDAYYAYAGDIATTNGDLLGMICNWAGPGGMHTPQNLFQSQQISLAASASTWTETAARLTYAPTNSCDASATMRFDADASGSIDTGANEGGSVTHDLDALTGGNTTVAQELGTRGVTKPTLY